MPDKEGEIYYYNNNRYNIKSIQKSDLDKIIDLLESIQFGSVTIIIQHGRISQIEKNEKVRLK